MCTNVHPTVQLFPCTVVKVVIDGDCKYGKCVISQCLTWLEGPITVADIIRFRRTCTGAAHWKCRTVLAELFKFTNVQLFPCTVARWWSNRARVTSQNLKTTANLTLSHYYSQTQLKLQLKLQLYVVNVTLSPLWLASPYRRRTPPPPPLPPLPEVYPHPLRGE